jgi:hypothetical protein
MQFNPVCSDLKYVRDLRQDVGFSPDNPIKMGTNKTVRHDIAKKELKVALNTINQRKPSDLSTFFFCYIQIK